MTASDHTQIQREKERLRALTRRRRRELPGKEQRSRQIMQRIAALAAFRQARSVLFYVDVRDEVRTCSLIERTLTGAKTVAVPYCRGGELELFRLVSMSELGPGAYGIPEPHAALRQLERRIDPQSIDVALVPGLAFDSSGGRLGHGQGYYDKLLGQLRADCIKIGVAFDCQLVGHVPTSLHDVAVDWVITEESIVTA